MKHPYAVSFVKTSETLRWLLLPNAYEVRKDFRWKWQGRVARWLFRKLGTDARDPRVDVERVVIDPTDIMRAIFEQRGALLDGRREPKRLLIGADDFAELMRTVRFNDVVNIDCEYNLGNGRGYKVCGLEVQIIPWMRGFLVMP